MKWIQTPPRRFNPPQLLIHTAEVESSNTVYFHRDVTVIRYTCRTTHGNKIAILSECSNANKRVIELLTQREHAIMELESQFVLLLSRVRPRYRVAASRIKRR